MRGSLTISDEQVSPTQILVLPAVPLPGGYGNHGRPDSNDSCRIDKGPSGGGTCFFSPVDVAWRRLAFGRYLNDLTALECETVRIQSRFDRLNPEKHDRARPSSATV